MITPFSKKVLLDNIPTFYKSSFLVNPSVYETIFQKLQLQKVYKDCNDLKVLDIYAGPGQQSLIFNEKFRPKQQLLMDNRPKFTNFWETHLKGSHLQLSTQDPYSWESYLMLMDYQKIFVPETQDRGHIHNKFFVMANVTDKKYEGLIMQWYNCIGQKNWVHRYGRVQMLVWMPTATAVKLLAPPKSSARSKASLVAETFTESKLIAITDDTAATKMDKLILQQHDPIMIKHADTVPNKRPQIPMSLLLITPRNVTFNKDNWDYITKQLMIQRKTPFEDAAEALGPGGREYFTQVLQDKNFMSRNAASFSAEEFILLTDIFTNWPFKPDIFMSLFDVDNDD